MRRFCPVIAALLLPVMPFTGCAGLDTSARAEGTGIQIIGAIVVLAKYQASQSQKVIAEQRARQAFVERALKPAYEERAKKLRKTAAAAPLRPRRTASSSMVSSKPPQPTAADRARAELAALSSSWKSVAERYTQGRGNTADFAVPGTVGGEVALVDFPKVSESNILAASAAYVPRYLAVPVPAGPAVPGAKETVMLWDTRAHRLASDTVYALDRTPPESKPAKIDGLAVQYEAP